MPRRIAPIIVLFLGGACEGVALSPALPELEPPPEAIDFGEVYVGARAVRTLTVANTGDGLLRLGPVASSDAVFATGTVPEIVNAGGRVEIEVTFAPRAAEASAGTLTLETNAGTGETVRIALTGVGVEPLDCDDGNACTADRFDPDAGTCERTPLEGACDDGSACTSEDRCALGECIGRAIDCDDGVACTRDLCDPAVGCVTVGDDTQCVDDDPCTLDRCAASGCENPAAPDGHVCGDVVSCVSAEICILEQCVTVSIPDGAPCDDGNVCTVGDQCAAETCSGTPLDRPPVVRAQTTMVHEPRSATLVGDHLYVATPVADRPRFKVVAFDGAAPIAAPTASFSALEGSAALQPVGADAWARVRTSSTSRRWVEVIGTANPAQPVLLSRAPAGFDVLDDTALAVGNALFFCSAPALGAPPEIAMVDLTDPRQPGAPQFFSNAVSRLACGFPSGQYVAADGIWVAWDQDGDTAGFNVYRLSASGVVSLLNHGFAMNGISRYGGIESIETDGHRVLVDLDNERYFFAVDLDVSPPVLARVQLAAPPPPRLLTLRDRIAYFGIADQIVAYDFTDADAPMRLPDTVAVDQPVTRFDDAVAIDGTRLVLRAGRSRLEVFERTANGLANVFTLKGRGAFGRILEQPSGLIGVTSAGVTFVDPAALPVATLAETPSEVPFSLSAPHLVDGPDGPAGLFAPLLEPVDAVCSPFSWGCDRTQPTPLDYELGTVAVFADGTATATPTQVRMTNDPAVVAAIDACIGAAFDDYVRASRYLVVDRCRAPDVVEVVAAIPATVPPDLGVSWTRTRLHGNGYATFLGRGFAVLFDYRQPLAPVVAAEVFGQPGAAGGFLGAAFDGRRWILTHLDDAGLAKLDVYEVRAGGLASLGQATFDTTHGLPVRNVLALKWPHLYIGADRNGTATLLVYDLAAPIPVVVHSVDLDSPAVDLVDAGAQLYVSRADGLTVVEPACAP